MLIFLHFTLTCEIFSFCKGFVKHDGWKNLEGHLKDKTNEFIFAIFYYFALRFLLI